MATKFTSCKHAYIRLRTTKSIQLQRHPLIESSSIIAWQFSTINSVMFPSAHLNNINRSLYLCGWKYYRLQSWYYYILYICLYESATVETLCGSCMWRRPPSLYHLCTAMSTQFERSNRNAWLPRIYIVSDGNILVSMAVGANQPRGNGVAKRKQSHCARDSRCFFFASSSFSLVWQLANRCQHLFRKGRDSIIFVSEFVCYTELKLEGENVRPLVSRDANVYEGSCFCCYICGDGRRY